MLFYSAFLYNLYVNQNVVSDTAVDTLTFSHSFWPKPDRLWGIIDETLFQILF